MLLQYLKNSNIYIKQIYVKGFCNLIYIIFFILLDYIVFPILNTSKHLLLIIQSFVTKINE